MTHSVEIEKHPLKPFLPANAKLLMLGSFPPPKTRWKMDFYYPNFQNDMWKIFGLCFFQDKNYFLNIEQKTFKEQQIRTFLNERGIAIFDTAYEVIRQKGNASDKFLHIINPTNVQHLLEKMPECHSVMTTGDKAIVTVDVWEHAYYIDYRNARQKFVEVFFSNFANWDFAAKNFA